MSEHIVVDGLKFDFTRDELYNHLKERVRHHSEQETKHQKELGQMIDEQQSSGQGFFANPTNRGLRQAKQEMVNDESSRATHFKMLMDHLIPDSTYRLGMRDLRDLDLTTPIY